MVVYDGGQHRPTHRVAGPRNVVVGANVVPAGGGGDSGADPPHLLEIGPSGEGSEPRIFGASVFRIFE